MVNTETNYAPPGGSGLRIHPAFDLRVLYFGGYFYLCLDHRLIVRSVLSLASLLQRDRSLRLEPGQRVLVRGADGWSEARLSTADPEGYALSIGDGADVHVPMDQIFPDLSRSQIARLAPALGVSAQDLERSVKQLSYLTVANAPRARLSASTEFAGRLAKDVFPVVEGSTTIALDPAPATLRPPAFSLANDLIEADVSFDRVDRAKRGRDIVGGLTKFGAYEKPGAPVRLLVLSTREHARGMDQLVDRMNAGAVRYPGAQRTFGTRFEVIDHQITGGVAEYDDRIRAFVRGPHRAHGDIALVYLPKTGDSGDPSHPYFRTKARLVREGLASQMVDESTVLKPDWRDMNLALNVYAKAGKAPWVLDEAMPEVDLFIGLSSSAVRRGNRTVRMMGYVNVFDSYGRWRFYQGDSAAFNFDERLRHFAELVKNSLAAYRAENTADVNLVHIHLTKRFSDEERAVLAGAVRSSAPNASVVFVWVNPHHVLRLFDLTSGSDGRVRRATYLRDGTNRLYMATTGANVFGQQGMGTPIPLELNVWADPPSVLPDLRVIGQQILSLTRLNWASSRSFCQEPITTKYAGDIARLMTAFMEDPTFAVAPSLRGTPWFL